MTTMKDAATFTAGMMDADVIGGYFGGPYADRAWEDAEWAATGSKPKLPIWVPKQAATQADARGTDIYAIVNLLIHHNVPHGCPVAFDLEASKADVTYMTEISSCLSYLGFGTVVYGSQSVITQDAPAYLWRWGADWTGAAHLNSGEVATQWEDAGPWDVSDVSGALLSILTWK